MKALTTILFLAIIGAGVYYFFFSSASDTVEVTGRLQLSQQGNMDINAPQVSGPLYYAVVKGTAKNNSKKQLKNIFIKYKIAGQSTSAMLFDVLPGQQVQFTTKSIRTKAANPEYYLENVQYDEKN